MSEHFNFAFSETPAVNHNSGLIDQLISDTLVGGMAGYAVGHKPATAALGALAGVGYGLVRHELLIPLIHGNDYKVDTFDKIFEDTMAGGATGYLVGGGLRTALIGAGVGLAYGAIDQLVIEPLFKK